MEISSDISLRGSNWEIVFNKMTPFFKDDRKTAVLYYLYLICLAIGLKKGERLASTYASEKPFEKSISRTIFMNDADKVVHLERIYQSYILTVDNTELNEKERLSKAFKEKIATPEINILTEFANFGANILANKLCDCDGKNEQIDTINSLILSLIEGSDNAY